MNNPFKRIRKFNSHLNSDGCLPSRQRGAMTLFTGVLILLLLTEMIIYAVSVSVSEQRKSANDVRQKLAFHAAESGNQFGKEFLLANSVLVPSAITDLLPDGADGWLSAGAERWQKCSDVDLSAGYGTHPCFGESIPALRDGSFYYSFDGSTELPIDINALIPGTSEQVSVHALLCMLELDRDADPVVQGCTTDILFHDDRYFLLTLLARGEADCDSGNCSAEALISEKFGSFGPVGLGGIFGVPLTTKSTFPPTGTAEIVPNPNGGGPGVPTSAWMNNNSNCPNQPVVDATEGSWSTCERHEWYRLASLPDDYACPGNNCTCSAARKRISYAEGGQSFEFGIDLVEDEDFPCDLFEHFFGISRSDYQIVKSFSQVINDCSTLGPNSFGIYWVTGADCIVSANTTLGSPNAPVFLISAATETRFNGGARLYGVLFITDVEDANAEFNAIGAMTIYGAAIIDGTLGQYQGTFQIVYIDDIVEKSLTTGGIGIIAGAWADFHEDWR